MLVLVGQLIFVSVTLLVEVTKADCQSLFKTDWTALTVDSGDDLKRAQLQASTSENGQLIKLQIINGTNWLNLGGDVHSFKLVLGRPPSTASDVSLQEALSQLNETGATGATGVLLEYHPPELKELADIANQNFMGVPVWSFHSLESAGSIPDSSSKILPALRWSQKRFGLDTVLERVVRENLLLHIDFERTKEILTSFYSYGQKPLTENSVTYLKRKYETVQRQFPNTFTEVYLNNLVHLVEADNKGASSAATLLPDLQELDEVYTKEDFDKVEDKLKLMTPDTCVLLQVRAGIFLQTESVENLRNVLKKHQNRLKILVTSYPHDQVAVKPLVTALDTLGRKNLILDFPESLTEQLKQVSHIPNNIKELVKSGSGMTSPFTFGLLFSSVIFFFL